MRDDRRRGSASGSASRPRFAGTERADALLSNTSRMRPTVRAARHRASTTMLDWVADWVEHGRPDARQADALRDARWTSSDRTRPCRSRACAQHLREGQVIPGASARAHGAPHARRAPPARPSPATTVDAGAGGIAVGVHTTQFAIRDPRIGLFGPCSSWRPTMRARLGRTATVRDGRRRLRPHAPGRRAKPSSPAISATTPACSAWPHCATRPTIELLAALPRGRRRDPAVRLLPPAGGRRTRALVRFWRRFAEIDERVGDQDRAVQPLPDARRGARRGRERARDDIALYTGNDDNIVADLLTPFPFRRRRRQSAGSTADCSASGPCGRAARSDARRESSARRRRRVRPIAAAHGAALTDANAALFDVATASPAASPAFTRSCAARDCSPASGASTATRSCRPGQAEEITRVERSYPEVTDAGLV